MGIILVGIVTVISGMVIWKPIQFSELGLLFHDFQTARLVHFLCMSAIVAFLIVHVMRPSWCRSRCWPCSRAAR